MGMFRAEAEESRAIRDNFAAAAVHHERLASSAEKLAAVSAQAPLLFDAFGNPASLASAAAGASERWRVNDDGGGGDRLWVTGGRGPASRWSASGGSSGGGGSRSGSGASTGVVTSHGYAAGGSGTTSAQYGPSPQGIYGPKTMADPATIGVLRQIQAGIAQIASSVRSDNGAGLRRQGLV